MTKPFSFGELTARIRALLRRRSSSISPALRVDDLDVDPVRRRVSRGGRRISLTPKEFALLEYLVRNVGNVLTRAMIAEHVWDHHFDTFTNIIDVHIRYLRVKVDEGFATRLIHTVRGVGYMLSPDGP
jgi:two-component system copper resistance phosphate regulon response regulator CusR